MKRSGSEGKVGALVTQIRRTTWRVTIVKDMGVTRNISWSVTRSRTMADCPRQGFFEYYADGEAESYAAWNLKELVTLPMLAGEVVDIVISAALKKVAKREPLPTNMADVGARNFRKFVEASPKIIASMRENARTADARRRSPYRPLQSDWYGLDLGKDYEQRLEKQVADCLLNFEKSEVLGRILAVDPVNWGPFTRSMRTRPYFELDGTRAYTSFDFYFTEADTLFILDWKSGKASQRQREAADSQLSVYALYGVHELIIPEDHIQVQAIWLQEDVAWQPHEVTSPALRACEQRIRSEVAQEISLLKMNEANKNRVEYRADRADFPARPSGNKCAQCKYRELCPEGQVACSHIAGKADVGDR